MLSLPATWGGAEGGKWEADTACGPQGLACRSLTAPHPLLPRGVASLAAEAQGG